GLSGTLVGIFDDLAQKHEEPVGSLFSFGRARCHDSLLIRARLFRNLFQQMPDRVREPFELPIEVYRELPAEFCLLPAAFKHAVDDPFEMRQYDAPHGLDEAGVLPLPLELATVEKATPDFEPYRSRRAFEQDAFLVEIERKGCYPVELAARRLLHFVQILAPFGFGYRIHVGHDAEEWQPELVPLEAIEDRVHLGDRIRIARSDHPHDDVGFPAIAVYFGCRDLRQGYVFRKVRRLDGPDDTFYGSR